jgi:hypothetical protein
MIVVDDDKYTAHQGLLGKSAQPFHPKLGSTSQSPLSAGQNAGGQTGQNCKVWLTQNGCADPKRGLSAFQCPTGMKAVGSYIDDQWKCKV